MKIFEYIKLPFDYLLYRYCRLFRDILPPRMSAYEDGCVLFFFTLSLLIEIIVRLIEYHFSLQISMFERNILGISNVALCLFVIGLVFPYIFKNYDVKLEEKWKDEECRYEKASIPIILSISSFVLMFYIVTLK